MEHIDLIEAIFVGCGYYSYLELGVWNGANFARMAKHARRAVGVDVVDNRIDKSAKFFSGTTHEPAEFFLGTTDLFFRCTNDKIFDLIFIDADHRYEQVKKDLESSLTLLSDGGTIVLHDTDPATAKLLGDGYCSDSYKILRDLRSDGRVDFVTLPMNEAGLTIVKPRHSERHLEFV